jgi:hypothetical protein
MGSLTSTVPERAGRGKRGAPGPAQFGAGRRWRGPGVGSRLPAMLRSLVTAFVLVAPLAAVGCYDQPQPACTFRCAAADQACPSGYQCGGDDRCHLVMSGGGLAQCEEADAPVQIDATATADAAIDAATDAAVDAGNMAPTITGQNAVTTMEDTARTIVLADLTVTDPDSTVFTLAVMDGTNYTRVGATITPASNFTGALTVPVTVSDDVGATSAVFNLMVSVTAVNDAPVITGQNVVTGAVATARTIAFADLLVTDPDDTYPTGFTLTVMDGTGYARTGNAITPDAGTAGTNLTVPVQVNDGSANSNVFNLTVAVAP